MTTGHKNGCACGPCRDYANAATKKYYLRQAARARGVQYDIDLIDAEPTRQILVKARRRGLSYSEIKRLTGIGKETTMLIYLGRRKKVQRRTAKQIARGLEEYEDIRHIADNSLVPIADERDIIRRLSAQGWTSDHLIEILQNNNMGTGVIIDTLLRGRTKKALAGNLRQVHWLAQVIGDKPGPSRRAMLQMQKRGYFPLRHYDSKGKLNVRSLTDEQRQWVR